MRKIKLSLLLLSCLLAGCIGVEELVKGIGPLEQPQELDEATIVAGLKEALSVGTRKAVDIVAAENGYFANSAIKIQLPAELDDVAAKLRSLGFDEQVDEFILTMNRAAEEAAAKAAEIFIDAVKQMTLADARRILQGADDAATRYFEEKTRGELYRAFAPVIENAMQKVGVIKVYNFLIDTYNKIPLVRKVEFDLPDYVNNKALDGLFHMLAKEEGKIRKDPAARVTDLLKRVFGSR